MQRIPRSLKIPIRTLLIFLSCLALTVVGHSQYRAGLQGTITDTQGSLIPNATVTILDKETNQKQTTKSDAGGTYTFNRLAPALYSITAESQGFTTKTVDNIAVQAEQMQSLNVQLDVGSAGTQTVTVNAEPGGIDTETGNVSGTISARQLETMPSSNRDPYQLLRLVPGMTGDSSQSAGGGSYSLPGNGGIGGSGAVTSIFQVENRPQTQANGSRTSANSFQVDGSQVNSLTWGGGAVITPNEESIKEVQVQSSPYDSSNGRGSGAQVQVVSKNGTNNWHGSAFVKIHRPGLNAFQPYNGPFAAPQRDENRFNQEAGSIGGPIWKNHVFFFFSYETVRNNSTATGNGWYETPNFDSLIASANNGSIASLISAYPGEGASYSSISNTATCANAGIAPAYCQQVTVNGITGLDVGSPLRTPLGTPDPTYVNAGQPGRGNGFDGVPDIFFVNTTNPSSSTNEQYNGRLDWQLTQNDLIAYSIYWVPTESTSYNGPTRAANLWHSNRLSYSQAFLYNHTFNPSLLNEFRLNAVRWYFDEISTNPQAPFGLPRAGFDAIGNSSTNANLQALGGVSPGIFAQTSYNIRDIVTRTWGSQNIRFGFDGYLDRIVDSLANIPSYQFRNIWDFANDAPYNEAGRFDPRTGLLTNTNKHVHSRVYAGYIQDDWRVKPNLTVNLGVRWEYFTPISEQQNNISNAILGSGANTLTNLGLKVGGDPYDTSKNNWGPQVGFAWTPNPSAPQQFVVRGGFGMSYNRMQEAITLQNLQNPPLVTNLAAQCTDAEQTNCPGILYQAGSDAHSINSYPSNPAAVQSFGANGLPTSGAPISIYAVPRKLSTPLTYHMSLGWEYAITPTWIASMGYQGSLSRHFTRQSNLNWIYYPNLNPMVNQMNYYSNDVNGNSHALVTELKHTFAHNFQLDVQYRFGKTMDEASQDYYIDQYPYDVHYAYGPADYDMTQNFKVHGLWTPKLFPSHNALEKIAGGWTISGIVQSHTGFPWTPVVSAYACNIVYVSSGYCSLRPASYTGQGNSDRSNSAFKRIGGEFPNGALSYFSLPNYEPASGIPPAPGVGRNSLRGPRYLDTDVSAQKTFGVPKMGFFGEGAGLTIRGDFFNVFNNLNFDPSQIDNVVSSDGATSNLTFGQAKAALGARVIEFQARFSF